MLQLHVKAMLLLRNNMKEAIKYCNDGSLWQIKSAIIKQSQTEMQTNKQIDECIKNTDDIAGKQ